MSRENTKAQGVAGNISAESILIKGESKWIQTKTVIWFYCAPLKLWTVGLVSWVPEGSPALCEGHLATPRSSSE